MEMSFAQIIAAVADGTMSDADVVALGFSRRDWIGYKLEHGSAHAQVAAYWHIVELHPRADAYVAPVYSAAAARFHAGPDPLEDN